MVAAVRFGAYELNLQTRELRKNGMRLRVPDQSIEILALLVERPSVLVTRDEIRRRLWSDGTVVEFEHSISSAVARLREALGESSAQPRFIETVPKHGYRFIAQVQHLPGSSESAPPLQSKSRWSLRASDAASMAGALIAAVGLLWWTRPISPGQEIVVEALTRDGGRTTDVAISPEGKVIVYSSDRAGDGVLNLWTRRLDGGAPVRLTTDAVNDHEPAFSPDEASIVFRSEKDGGGIYAIPALGGQATRLLARGRTPRYSPDGRWIAYWIGIDTGKDSSEAYVASADGHNSTRIFSELPAAAAPVWSSDGRAIAVARSSGARAEVWSAAFDPQSHTTGKPQAMGFGELNGTTLLSTGLFTSIQFLSDRSMIFSQLAGGAANLYRVEISGNPPRISGAPHRLTIGSTKELPFQPVANLIPFASVSFSLDLWQIDIDADRGETAAKPTRIASGWINDQPSLTPDGSRLAYLSNRFGQGRLGPGGRYCTVLSDLSSGREALITSPVSAPIISPDGRRIANSTNNGIYSTLVESLEDIREPELVCPGCSRPYAFSSTGDRLLYGGRAGIDVLDVATRIRTHLIDSAATLYSGARMSPDDRWIAFNEVRPGVSRIWIAPFRLGVEKSDWIDVSGNDVWEDKPRWSPDGNLLYFTSDRDGFRCIWTQRLDAAKRPAGPPRALYHSHNSRSCMLNVEPIYAGLEVARGKLIYVNGEITGDLWLLRIPRH
jgi:Tol biopolymer transport system component/DNA-binding winged helix-turn-helix (wHTH) protein